MVQINSISQHQLSLSILCKRKDSVIFPSLQKIKQKWHKVFFLLLSLLTCAYTIHAKVNPNDGEHVCFHFHGWRICEKRFTLVD